MKYYRKMKAAILMICFTLIAGCSNTKNTYSKRDISVNNVQNQLVDSSSEDMTETSVVAENTSREEPEREEENMTIKANETEYEVVLNQNESVKNIVENMPLTLDMVRYAGHEFYAELPFTPAFDQERTSEIKAGHVYYWDGWNAFVINYIDSDIGPYKVVHIGEIKDKSICDILATGTDNIQIGVK